MATENDPYRLSEAAAKELDQIVGGNLACVLALGKDGNIVPVLPQDRNFDKTPPVIDPSKLVNEASIEVYKGSCIWKVVINGVTYYITVPC